MVLEESLAAEIKRRWRVVRRDDYSDLPGEIVAADDIIGTARMKVVRAGEEQIVEYNLGPGMIRLQRARY